MENVFSILEIAKLLTSESFSSPWYWLFFCMCWSVGTYYTLGIGHQDARRATPENPAEMADFELGIDLYLRQNLPIFDRNGAWLIGGGCFALATIAGFGFTQGAFFLQALFLLIFPFFMNALIGLNTAYRIRREQPRGIALRNIYFRLRRRKQFIGFVAIFVTALWGAFVVFTNSLVMG